jgi:hypothetical protein
MKRDAGAPILSAIFVDYDNIYMSLRRKSEDAAKRFPKAAAQWLKGLESGRLVTPATPFLGAEPRRIVSIRCYGNPVPRRNTGDNSTDMNSFPFVRHHFLRAGCEVIDCPPLTSHHKNAADIRMVMDLRDYLTHETYFDEFVILSGDADFTPVLHRLRQHARRTVIYSNDHTASAYSAICDGEVRETDLIGLLLAATEGTVLPELLQAPVAPQVSAANAGHLPAAALGSPVTAPQPTGQLRIDDLRQMILSEVVAGIRAASGPVPLEALADRALRAIGHDRTIGTAWAGAGTFRDLLRLGLPSELRVTEQAPFFAYDPQRHAVATPLVPAAEPDEMDFMLTPAAAQQPRSSRPLGPEVAPVAKVQQAAPPVAVRPASEVVMHRGAVQRSPSAPVPPPARPEFNVHRAMERIQEACQAPPLSPQDYRGLFEVMAAELTENGISGSQTVGAILTRASERGIASLRRQDVQFVLDVVGEADPWFEQPPTPALFAGRFRNFVVARCREQGLVLSMKELDLIDSWFMAGAGEASGMTAPVPAEPARSRPEPASVARPAASPVAQAISPPAPVARREPAATAAAPAAPAARNRWWAGEEPRAEPAAPASPAPDEELPRFVRHRR